MTDLTVAKTIAEQLGGTGKLHAMIGAHAFTGGANNLLFMFKARAKNGANVVDIILNGMDTYDVAFYKMRGSKHSVVSKETDIGCENLKQYIESETGLYLSFR